MDIKPLQTQNPYIAPKAPVQIKPFGSERSQGTPDSDSVELGGTPTESYAKPEFSGSSGVETPKPKVLTDNPDPSPLNGFTKAVLIGVTGAIGLGAITGCTPPSGGTSTVVNTEAMQELTNTFSSLQESIAEDGSQSRDEVAGEIFKAIGDYSRSTGEKGDELMGSLGGVIRQHPVLAATIAFTAGNAIGIGMDRLGVTDQIGQTAGDVANWVKENPIKSVAIGVAVAGAGYLLYNHVIKPMAEVPPAPTGEHAEAMEQTFADLEQMISNHQGTPEEAAAEASLTLGQKIKEYAAATGRSANEVKNDVTAWAYDHPVVATSLVMGAGVGTGVLLSRAGVPEGVAGIAGAALDASGAGVDAIKDFAKENPVLAGAVTAAVAVGAGYLIYQAVAN